jgi:hypothetical protein
MSFRDTDRSMVRRLEDLEARVRKLERPSHQAPDPGWVLTKVSDTEMAYLYLPTGATGPVIGVQ